MPTEADILVIFGITGDLAKKMTFEALYRLESRGELNCRRILGIARNKWTDDELEGKAREAIQAKVSDPDEEAMKRLDERLDYVQGEFDEDDLYAKLAEEMGTYEQAVFYLEVPPSLFGLVVKGLHKAGLTDGAPGGVRKALRARPRVGAGAQRRDLQGAGTRSSLPDRPLPRQGAGDGHRLSAVRELDPGTGLEPPVRRLGADHDGRGLRRRRPRELLRRRRRAARRRAEPPPADARAGRDGAALGGHRRRRRDPRPPHRPVPGDARGRPDRYFRGQYNGYQHVDGVKLGSDTETFVALRLEVDNWRWTGVPFYIRAGKAMPVEATEIRVVFKRPPRLGIGGRMLPDPDELIIRVKPEPGAELCLIAKKAGEDALHRVHLDLLFDEQDGPQPEPYERLLRDALRGDPQLFPNFDSIDQTWRIVQPLLDNTPQAEPYEPGSWGPEAASHLLARPRRLAPHPSATPDAEIALLSSNRRRRRSRRRGRRARRRASPAGGRRRTGAGASAWRSSPRRARRSARRARRR